MDMTKTVYGIVGVVLGILLIAALVIPVVEETGYTKIYEDNADSNYRYDIVSELTLTFDGTALQPYGAAASLPTSTTVMATDTLRVVHTTENTLFLRYYANATSTQLEMAAGDSITMARGVATIDFANESTADVTLPYSGDIISYDVAGDYISIRDEMTGALLCNSDSKVYFVTGATGFLGYAEINKIASGSGSMEVRATGSTSSIDFTWSAVADDKSVYTVSSPSLTVNDTEYKPAFFVPFQYYELEKGDSMTSTLFSVVPLLLIVAVLMVAVRMIGGRD